MQVVLATRNRDKIKEIEAILAPIHATLIDLDHFDNVGEVVEDGETLEENALKKARETRDATGVSALADDTGLGVDALDGAPGVYSSRYAGEDASYADNCEKLLRDMESVPDDRRGAHFRCVMALALVEEDARVLGERIADHPTDGSFVMDTGGNRIDALVTEGIVQGRITTEPRGSSGFGYDPVFEVSGLEKTLAELSLEDKNRISHRYRALVEMRELLLRYRLAEEG